MQQKVTCLGRSFSNLDLKRASVTSRLPVRERDPNGIRTRPVDHFTESGINPATRPSDAITHETVDHFLSLTGLFARRNVTKDVET